MESPNVDDGVSLTRVFVSGLPPSFKSEQLRAHFAGKYQVTDAHVVPDRRIGFVGFAKHEDAQNAAKYFNKTFIRMSKIGVALAKPVEMLHGTSGQAAPVSQRALRQRDPNRSETARFTGSRKRKRDLRDDGELAQRERERDAQGTNIGLEDNERDGQPGNDGGDTNTKLADGVQAVGNPEATIAGAGKSRSSLESEISNPEETAGPNPVRSDADWLRGKTNRLLDLVESDGSNTRRSAPTDSPVGRDVDRSKDHDDDEHRTVAGTADGHVPTEDIHETRIPNGRLFVRNLPFHSTDDDMGRAFSKFGKLAEIHIVRDTKTSVGKGMAFIQFLEPDDAEKALADLDGKPFQGRLMHILPASDKKSQKLDEFELAKLPLKKQMAWKRKAAASTSSFSWNSLYMNPDAVLASVAHRLGVSKSELLDPASADAAVKQAHAETSVIKDTKEYLASRGVNVEAFKNKARDGNSLLLKNFPFGTTAEEISQLLSPFGKISRLVFPPTGTMAVVQYEEGYAASQALKQLAYRNLKGSVLFLEKAPQGLWDAGFDNSKENAAPAAPANGNPVTGETTIGATFPVFVRNLNFATNSVRLAEAFTPLSGFLSARVKTRTDAKRPGEALSMGFGFVEFRTKTDAEAAIAAMNGRRLDGHELVVQASRATADAAEERRKEDMSKKVQAKKTKIIIKNLPFEATKKDIRALFGAYGQLRSVRVPKKFDHSTRGFAFADFVTPKEAENAMDALSNTHLLGRRLVLEFTEGESVDPEEEIRAMEKKVQSHQTTLAHHELTTSARKKFNVGAGDDPDW